MPKLLLQSSLIVEKNYISDQYTRINKDVKDTANFFR